MTGLPSLFPDDESRWAAFLARDRRAEGVFVVAVRSTGIVCRPTCAARPARRHVTFLPDRDTAFAAGFRACRCCHP